MAARFNFFAVAPRGTEPLVAAELERLGAARVRPARAGVGFQGSLEDGYRACLWSRIASRILLRLDVVAASSGDELYAGVHDFAWEEHLDPDGTLAVMFVGTTPAIRHTHFGALKVKDAIVDRLRERSGRRPSVDTDRPDLRVHGRLHNDRLTLSIDLAGTPLHRRGYRSASVEAPLKENLAAAILMAAGWPEMAAANGALVDPMCGSGTLPLEAAMMAADIAPGLLRDYFGFTRWQNHDPDLWERLVAEAQERRAAGLDRLPSIIGHDVDMAAIDAARRNAAAAGLEGHVAFERRDIGDCRPAPPPGLVVANPPYGERLGDRSNLPVLYRRTVEAIARCYPGWQAAIFTADPEFRRRAELGARRKAVFFNGPLQCDLLGWRVPAEVPAAMPEHDPGREAFANRLRKNLRQLGRWARKEGVHCYRLYDADMPEYAVAVDLYEGPQRWIHIQEYAPPADIDPRRAALRRETVRTVVPEVLELSSDHVFYKLRERQKGRGQYGKLADVGRFQEVWEAGARLLVNFTDYLDTGLFLDHRPTRLLLRDEARGKRFLNLFAYTGSATVQAALGGAASTLSVDLSSTYMEWARKNLDLNGLTPDLHRLERADCLEWLADERGDRFDLIFLDPPTFSNSKRMDRPFDVVADHPWLIRRAMRLLNPGGTLIFSNNARTFRMDREALPGLQIEDISRATLPRDFERNPRIHNCWRITRS